ncbi:DUF222 domain-containing protein, partial [Rhizobium johnstonii]|uniref:DUF222 domain-containing protein n=1 Tax=Rhizobium johnstonii TaxID=3019933 RepID=UPI003F948A71
VEPSFTEFQQRGITTGRPLPGGGLVPVKGLLLPEVAGKLQRLFDALTNPRQTGRFLTPEQQAEADELGVRDPRSRAQRQHDALATILDVAGR